MSEPWTQAEWERRKASVLEDIRILQAEVNEQLENANFLRERGHDFPAEVLEHNINKVQRFIQEMRDGFAELENGEED